MTFATDTSSWELLIPLVVVFGIFVVGPLTRRGQPHRWDMMSAAGSRAKELLDTQKRILDELETVRKRLDDIERVLTTVD
jgi:hypothetical protein